MDLNRVNALKQKGNDAFKMGNLLEAINSYTEAIGLAESLDASTKAVLYSNRAQAMLKGERYAEALVDAEESLKCDPNFMKSVFRRATANAKLGNNEKAVKDLREVLKQDPANLSAKNLMSDVSKPAQMNVKFAGAHIGHYLRRVLTVRNAHFVQVSNTLSKKLPRIMFLSTKGGPFVRKVLEESIINEGDSPQRSIVDLTKWCLLKRLKVDPKCNAISMLMSDAMLRLIVDVFRPSVHLLIVTDKCAQRYGNLCEFSGVTFVDDIMFSVNRTDHKMLKTVESCSNVLTRLPYSPEIVKFKDKSFPSLNTLLVTDRFVVDMKFLKLWKKQKWGINKLVFRDCFPDLVNFERFGGQISSDVTRVHMSFMHPPADILRSNGLGEAKHKLNTMKQVFPNLTEVIGGFAFEYENSAFVLTVEQKLKAYISYLATKVDANVKPEWCAKLKILVGFIGRCNLLEIPQLDRGLLKRVVDELRTELGCLDHISLHGPSPNSFGWDEVAYSPVLIKMSTKHADFEVTIRFAL